jgi:beta-galactosidase
MGQVQPHHFDFDYISHLMSYYGAFFRKGVPVDMVPDRVDFRNYKLLIAPLIFLTSPALLAKLRAYVASGGHLVLTMRSGVKDWNNQVIPHTLPGPLTDLVGLSVYDYDCQWGVSQALRWQDERGSAGPEACRKWCDIITPSTANPLAWYTQDYYRDTPAITVNAYGKGMAYYVGTELGAGIMDAFIGHALAGAGIAPIITTRAPAGVEVTRRRTVDKDFIFILNHNNQAIELTVPSGWKMLIGGEARAGDSLHLDAFGAALCTSD